VNGIGQDRFQLWVLILVVRSSATTILVALTFLFPHISSDAPSYWLVVALTCRKEAVLLNQNGGKKMQRQTDVAKLQVGF
jgi:hypothetical protein